MKLFCVALCHVARAVFITAVPCVPLTVSVQAADTAGQHAIRGAGLINCSLFVKARAERNDAYLVTAAWVDGYISGINQHASQTYDLLSFESTELLMAIVNNHCVNNPSDPVFGVIANLFERLWGERLTSKSDKQTVTAPGREARHYDQLIERMQQKLAVMNFYDGDVNATFSNETSEALKRFQDSIGFKPTGFPDQMTLWRLMRSE